MRELGAMPSVKCPLIPLLILHLLSPDTVCCRYNAPSVVFLCLPALLAQPLRGAAAFCWQDVLQGVCGMANSVWHHLSWWDERTRWENFWLMTSEITARVAWWSQNSLTFPSILFCWCNLLLNKTTTVAFGYFSSYFVCTGLTALIDVFLQVRRCN